MTSWLADPRSQLGSQVNALPDAEACEPNIPAFRMNPTRVRGGYVMFESDNEYGDGDVLAGGGDADVAVENLVVAEYCG
jgi:hypothetical protein